ncbi:MAG: hypothetical protein ABIH21_00445 [Patescibacteria group bacterium]
MIDVKTIVEDGVVDADEVKALEADLYEDGVIDRDEADALFEINDAVTGNANDPSWDKLFVKALTDHVLADDTSPGELDAEEAEYLIGKIQGDGQVDGAERALCLNILENATAVHESFVKFCADNGIAPATNAPAYDVAVIVADGVVDEDEVATLKTAMLADGVIDRQEAEDLFAISDGTSGAENCAAWGDFFVESITAHVLADDESPGVLDEDESTWLINKVKGDGQVDDLEKRLCANILKQATDVHAKFTMFCESNGITAA